MGTLFMRMSSEEHTLAEIKKLILNDINSRNPTGLVRKWATVEVLQMFHQET